MSVAHPNDQRTACWMDIAGRSGPTRRRSVAARAASGYARFVAEMVALTGRMNQSASPVVRESTELSGPSDRLPVI
jgi:hypothetical protein